MKNLKNYEELKKELATIIYNDEIENVGYRRDVRLHIDNDGNGTLTIHEAGWKDSEDPGVVVSRLGCGYLSIYEVFNTLDELAEYLEDGESLVSAFVAENIDKDFAGNEFSAFIDWALDDRSETDFKDAVTAALKDTVSYSDCEESAEEDLDKALAEME